MIRKKSGPGLSRARSVLKLITEIPSSLLHFQIRRIADGFTFLLYKIDSILLRSNGCVGFKMTVEMALVEKTTLKGGICNISPFSEKFFGLFSPAIHL